MGIILAPLAVGLFLLVIPAVILIINALRSDGSQLPGVLLMFASMSLGIVLSLWLPFAGVEETYVSWSLVFQIWVGGGGTCACVGLILTLFYIQQKKPRQAYLGAGCFLAGAAIPIAWFSLAGTLMNSFELTFQY